VQGNNLRAAFCRFANVRDSVSKVVFGVGRAFHLHQADGKFVRHDFYFITSNELSRAYD
jgi:dTDP-4-dehydrorhamnose 3,5-epimerase-like enzyme